VNAEIVAIGDELVLGFTVDTNGPHLARSLGELGATVARRTLVGDDHQAIVSAVRESLERCGAVITTGGLGPTSDDITRSAVAEVFGRALEVDAAHLEWMHQRWKQRFDTDLPESNAAQALVPVGATVLRNAHGSAPGLWLEDERGWVAMLPGVPRELRGMAADTLVPRLADRFTGGSPVASVTLRTTGIPESALSDIVRSAGIDLQSLSLSYLPGVEGVDLRLTTRGLSRDEAGRRLEAVAAALRSIVGESVYGEGSTDLPSVVVDQCRARGLTLAVAESCTGGMLGERITAISGSSDVFLGGVIAYSNDVKTGQLGVPGRLLEEHGAVSERVALAMAAAVRSSTGASIGISITGVAGPDGGTVEKPVGTVWFAVDMAGEPPATVLLRLWGDRAEIRFRATQAALEHVRRRTRPRGG
jgi:nicotinamide-nucleotide amidase